MSWICSCCGEAHEDIPFSFAADYPDNYANLSSEDRENRAVLSSDQCIIDSSEFYIRGLLELRIRGAEDPFLWGVWANLFEEDFDSINDSWELSGRETHVGPFKGRLANRLAVYPVPTANLKLRVEIQPVGKRPVFVLEEINHPLATAQRDGLSYRQACDLAAAVMHNSLYAT
jgi:hypothetical protein